MKIEKIKVVKMKSIINKLQKENENKILKNYKIPETIVVAFEKKCDVKKLKYSHVIQALMENFIYK